MYCESFNDTTVVSPIEVFSHPGTVLYAVGMQVIKFNYKGWSRLYPLY